MVGDIDGSVVIRRRGQTQVNATIPLDGGRGMPRALRACMRAPAFSALLVFCLAGLGACSSAVEDGEGDEQAIEEATAPQFTTEAEIAAGKFEREILPYFKARSRRGAFDGSPRRDGSQPKIVYDVVTPDAPSQGALVISHGMTENSVKYAELVYDLHRAGLPLTMFLINHRGQGFSERLLADPMKCHVDDFELYVDDFATFVDRVVEPAKQKNLFAFAHSMGGGIFTRYLERHPGVFKTAVLSSPMHGVNTGWVPGGPLRLVLDAASVFAREEYFPKEPPAGPYTTSAARAPIQEQVYRLYPETKIGSITWGWFSEALGITRGAMKRDVSNITADIKLFHAAEDNLVDVGAVTDLCNAINKAGRGTCDRVPLRGAKHEVWLERDEIRNVVLGQTLEFFKKRMR